MQINKDWEAFYKRQDEDDPIWSGAKFKYEAKAVLQKDWKAIANAATSTFFQWEGRTKGMNGHDSVVYNHAHIFTLQVLGA